MTEDLNRRHVTTKSGVVTRLMAGICHKCKICPFADRKPYSAFGRIMRWHRTWCPAWAAHTEIYGRKALSK